MLSTNNNTSNSIGSAMHADSSAAADSSPNSASSAATFASSFGSHHNQLPRLSISMQQDYRPCSRESASSHDSYTSSFDHLSEDPGMSSDPQSVSQSQAPGQAQLGSSDPAQNQNSAAQQHAQQQQQQLGIISGSGATLTGVSHPHYLGATGGSASTPSVVNSHSSTDLSSNTTLEASHNGNGFMVRTRLDELHDFMVEVSWSELIRLLVDHTTSQTLDDTHLVNKLATFVRSELGHSEYISPFSFNPPPLNHGTTTSSSTMFHNGEPLNSISSDMESLAVHPYDVYPGPNSDAQSNHSSLNSVARSLPPGVGMGQFYPGGFDHSASPGLIDTNSAMSDPSRWQGHQPQGSIHNPGAAFGHQAAYPHPLDPPHLNLPPRSSATRPEARSRHSNDGSNSIRSLIREQARPYSRSGLPATIASSAQSIRSVKSDKAQSSLDGSLSSENSSGQPRPLQPLNGRTELYVFDELTQTVARVSPGMENLTGDAPVIEFPPGSYYRVFHEDLEVLPSDIGHGRAVLWLRGQRCVAKCRFRLEGKRPAVIRAHFATCKLRENLSIDPLGRLCRLQVEARRCATERDRERLANGNNSIRSLNESSCDSDDSRSIRSEYSIHSSSSRHSYSSLPQQAVTGTVRPIRSRQGDGRPLSMHGAIKHSSNANETKDSSHFGVGDSPMTNGDSTIGQEEGAYALMNPSAGDGKRGDIPTGISSHWSDQWLSKATSSDTLHGEPRTAVPYPLQRVGSQRSTRSAAISISAGGGGGSFLSIE